MMTWQERKRARTARAELRALDAHYGPRIKQLKGDAQESVIADYRNEAEFPRGELAVIESDVLRRRAGYWGVELPDQTSEWDEDITGRTYLGYSAKARVKRAVRQAMRAEIRWWAEVTVPILALLVALATIILDQQPQVVLPEIVVLPPTPQL
jgi:hypothetical protein